MKKQDREPSRSKYVLGRGVWALLGFVCFALAVIGVVLPVLPTTPFVLLAGYCFARSSEKVEIWFKSTKLYHKVLEDYCDSKQMTMKSKLSILIPVTCLMALAVFFMWHIVVMRYVMLVIWLGHVYYFGYKVPTLQES